MPAMTQHADRERSPTTSSCVHHHLLASPRAVTLQISSVFTPAPSLGHAVPL